MASSTVPPWLTVPTSGHSATYKSFSLCNTAVNVPTGILVLLTLVCASLFKFLSQRVFPTFDHSLRNLLPQFDGIKWFILSQSTQDSKLRAHHVAIGDGGDHFLCSRLDL